MSFIITIKLIFTFLSSLILIKLIMHNATFLGLIDIPNERSSHSKRGAGIGFGFAFFYLNFII